MVMANTGLPLAALGPISDMALSTTQEIINSNTVYVGDDLCFPLDCFPIPNHYKDTLESIMLPHGLIKDRVQKLAQDICGIYKTDTIHFLVVLKGSSIFFHDLMECIQRYHELGFWNEDHVPFTFDFLKAKSYQGTQSTGDVKIDVSGVNLDDLAGKHVLFVEDIVDTGHTMKALVEMLSKASHPPASIRCVSLLQKRLTSAPFYTADFIGFSIPDKFVVGYGLDFDEAYRDLRPLAVANAEGRCRYRRAPPPAAAAAAAAAAPAAAAAAAPPACAAVGSGDRLGEPTAAAAGTGR